MNRTDTPLPSTPLNPYQQELVRAELGLTENITAHLGRQWARILPQTEVNAIAKAALVEAALTFDPSQRVPFSNYAWFRVEGAVLDRIRSEHRFRGQAFTVTAYRAVSNYLADLPDFPEDNGQETGHLWRRRSEEFSNGVATTVVASMVADLLNSQDGSEEAIAARQAFDRVLRALQDAMAELEPKERALFDLYYGQGLGLRDVAQRMNISYSTVKRVHAAMLDHLGDKLRQQGFRGIEDTGIFG